MRYIQRLSMDCCNCGNNNNEHKRKSIDGQEYVEVNGLKWSTMNIGASKESEDGLYFAWGEIDGYTRYGKDPSKYKASKCWSNDWDSYKFYNSDTNSLIKYNSQDRKTTLDLEDDTAYILWGGKWRMPTKSEIQKLLSKSRWTNNYEGRAGFLYEDEKGNQLFFPGATNTYNPGPSYYNKQGCYWSNVLYKTGSKNALHLHITSGSGSNKSTIYDSETCFGFTVRPVWDENLETVQIPFTHQYNGVLFRVSGTNLEAFKYQGQYMCVSNADIVLQDIDESLLTEALNIIKEQNPDIKKVVTGDIRNYDKNRFNIDNIEEIVSI